MLKCTNHERRECIMKKKLLAMLSLVTILAMESVTVFATENTGAPSPNSGNVLYGDVTTAQVASETFSNASVEEIVNSVVVQIDEESGTVATDAGLVFQKDEDNGLKLIGTAVGTVLSEIVVSLDKSEGHTTTPFTVEETKAAVAVAQVASNLGKTVGANVQVSYAVNVESSTNENGEQNTNVSFNVGGKGKVKAANSTIIHIKHDNTTENLGAKEDENGNIVPERAASSLSPFILLVFDTPVPGLTTDVDYSSQSTMLTNGESSTVAGDVSPKTADAKPYTAMIAMLSIACVAVCTRKLAKR
jgi:hypothetical protein